ncbi:hypothetical protein E2N92_04855 [Methanofollis formosanus]|uniref:Uncharacterized protein n=1 Tax=Methanofollis formosanus TaxID=299308 RepID=A0A8G1A1H5_9EURY|nr:hypothetical protein [Methanofollis formosanus]QYZ78805.1 hypothetical protein E2N92_04855 [Methanofollis formosanus]
MTGKVPAIRAADQIAVPPVLAPGALSKVAAPGPPGMVMGPGRQRKKVLKSVWQLPVLSFALKNFYSKK